MLINNIYAEQYVIDDISRLSFVPEKYFIQKKIIKFDKSANIYNDKSYDSFNSDYLYNTKELVLAFSVNNVPRNHVDIVLLKNNDLYLSEESFNKLNIKSENKKKINYYSQIYYKLNDSNINYTIKEATSLIEITVPADQFRSSVIEPNHIWHSVNVPGTGAYINYDILYKYTKQPKIKALEGLWNTTIFHKQNVLTSDFKTVLDNSKKNSNPNNLLNSNDSNKLNKIIRLESKFIRDFPDKMLTLTIGDTRTNADLWGNPILLGGFQISTNFGLQPGFVYYPLPDITGAATLPSAVDLYINDSNRQRKNIQEGPFEILDIPIVSGGGEIKVIQQDLLGREKTYTIPYYLSSYALKPRVTEYSLTSGLIRNNFADNNDNYSKIAITANYRHGVTKHYTYALRGEAKEKQLSLGYRATYTKEHLGELNLLTVGSMQNIRNESGPGGLFKIIYINQYKNKINFNITTDYITEKFITLGDDPKASPYKTSFQAFIGIPLAYKNSFTINFINRNNREKDSESIISLNYFHNILNFASLNITSQIDLNDTKRKVFFLNLSKSLPEKNITTSLASNVENDQKPRYIFNLNKSVNSYNGFGYNFRASKKNTTDILADIKYDSPYNSLQTEYNYFENEHNFRFSARGGLAYLNQNFFVTRTIRDSFALINTNTLPEVGIYNNNRLITKTNTSGYALVPNLNSYNINKISLDPTQLSLNTNFIKTSEEIIPFRYTGTEINFKTEKHDSVIFRILDKNLKPLKPGSHIADRKDHLLTIVGYDGNVYLNLGKTNVEAKFNAHWIDSSCDFSLPVENIDSNEFQQNLGDIVCR